MNSKKTIIIKNINKKTGITNDKPWQLCRIEDENEKFYTTFDQKYCELLVNSIGREIEVEFEEEIGTSQYGKEFVRRNLIVPQEGKISPDKFNLEISKGLNLAVALEKIQEGFQKINEGLKEIITEIQK